MMAIQNIKIMALPLSYRLGLFLVDTTYGE
jgi:hypothetical protein